MKTVRFKLKVLLSYYQTKFLSFRDRATLDAWQKKQLKKYAKKVLQYSPYYMQYCNKDFSDWPVINKAIHMDNFDKINTVNVTKKQVMRVATNAESSRVFNEKIGNITVGLSSGTSGNRGIFLTSESEQANWAGVVLAKVLPSLRQKQRVALFLRANNNLYESVNQSRIKFQFFDLLLPFEHLISSLVEFKPTVLVAPASVLVLLARSAVKINPVKIVSVAEVLHEDQKNIIENYFKLPVHQIYQCTEGFLAVTCKRGNLHLNEDMVFIEKAWLDEDQRAFYPIITDFRRVSQPIVRYKLDDVLIEDTTPCPCGSVFTRIKKIVGRCDDILQLTTINGETISVFPDFICRAIILSNERFTHFQVIQTGTNKLRISLPAMQEDLFPLMAQSLNQLFIKLNIITPDYEFCEISQRPYAVKERRVICQLGENYV